MGGATFALPERDRTMFTRRYCNALMQVCFAGRIAEEMFCDDISSGAQSDIEQATKIARQMILTWGMSNELGLINYGGDSGMGEQIYGLPQEKEYSEKTAQEIDLEIKALTNTAYERAKELISTRKESLDKVAQALLKYETLDADDVQLILDGGTLDKPTVGDLLAAEQAKTPPSEEKPEEQP